ncbi:hypothetical protein PRZ48_011173 [Zasmidium cellare]|uniref:Methyltransferase type 11 domain-containing protein n=1 Tax=Zasmidium cellare TaxID=395010 RepID=A0ABR0EAN1_ZASCE|nr:hypothetical protein PRZ48_011173 [Zasmidium cellare]
MSAATATTTADPRHASYDLKTPGEHIALYDKWAATYNDDVMGPSTLYVGPKLVAEAVLAHNGKIDGPALDAGCGTGLSGVALAQVGAKTIDGIDVSPGMLKLARDTGVYRDLWPVDMTKPIEQPDEFYDVVTCVGTFTTGHVGPTPALPELVRVLKRGGLLVATILDTLWKPEGFEAEVERLRSTGAVDVLSTKVDDYRRGDNARAVMLVVRRK